MGEAAALAAALGAAVSGVTITSLGVRLPTVALSAVRMVVASAALLAVLIVSGQASELGDAGALTLKGLVRPCHGRVRTCGRGSPLLRVVS